MMESEVNKYQKIRFRDESIWWFFLLIGTIVSFYIFPGPLNPFEIILVVIFFLGTIIGIVQYLRFKRKIQEE